MTSAPPLSPAETMPLSLFLRHTTTAVHQEAEGTVFISDLLEGRSGVEAFTRLTEQLWFVYETLEQVIAHAAHDPRLSPLHDERLSRLPALENDLTVLRGSGWREGLAPVVGTQTYVARLREVADDPARLVAHHYTRYLGDLSGGQVIPAMLRRHYGITDGVSFYDFTAVGKVKPYKDAYRAALDGLPLSDMERADAADEAVRAFRLNSAVFADLAPTS